MRIEIRPTTPKESDGKWDWRVTVTRDDGTKATELVSGGRVVAESVARRALLAESKRKPNAARETPSFGERRAGRFTEGDVVVDLRDHRGDVYTTLLRAVKHPARGPGWYVQGAQPDNPNAVMIVAWPNVALRKVRGYSKVVIPGWRSLREAEAVIAEMVAQGLGTR